MQAAINEPCIPMGDVYKRESVMRGIATALRLGLLADHTRERDLESLVPLLDLLEELLPDKETSR